MRELPRPLIVALLLFASFVAYPEVVRLQILQTTDLHGYVERSDQLDSGGGMLRLATAVAQRREVFGADKTILIDSGDTIQGTWHAAYSRGQIAIECLKFLGYDVWVPGNHELDFGVSRLREICGDTASFVTAGNLSLIVSGKRKTLPPWRLIRRGGARVAVIGMTASALDLWFWGDQYRGYEVASAMERLEELLPQVLAMRPDMIILATHQGWLPTDTRGVNEVKAIAERFPEIDLILGGHTHWEHAGKIIGPDTWYMQAGRHADMLGVVFAEIDTEENRVVDIKSRLVTLDDSIPEDAELAAKLGELLKHSRKEASRVIGRASNTVSSAGRPGVDCEKSELLCRAIAEAADVSVVIHGRLTRYDLRPGPVTRREIYLMVPYENGIGVAELTPREIMIIMEEQHQQRDSYVACGLWGLNVDYDDNGKVTALLTRGGEKLAEDTRIPVAFNSYTLSSGGGRFPELRRVTRQSAANLQDTGLMTRAVLENYVRRHSPLGRIVPGESFFLNRRP
mgnify:FL=1